MRIQFVLRTTKTELMHTHYCDVTNGRSNSIHGYNQAPQVGVEARNLHIWILKNVEKWKKGNLQMKHITRQRVIPRNMCVYSLCENPMKMAKRKCLFFLKQPALQERTHLWDIAKKLISRFQKAITLWWWMIETYISLGYRRDM